ncbi:hypothetical protein PFICI_04003 [Pestalotiopsis fici W106-1]|uniref:Xaa-Pro dipeptidyl-peptidase-like domain-containing protein n=1 Tax=Pestalotiopsis fici (strain W106-1 / CGMCC3.15140) TaxID=1229662 RepID=W3XIT1_PESFW|nr:uncharacterized protein PFICI_04003 [Pestalotiopsis fici W106-1]ETS85978.1 hypothetical protein PFICI_04003 [Pestalotiopsis fici W106-1]
MGIATALVWAATAVGVTSAVTVAHAEDAAPYEANVTLLTQKVYGDDTYPVWHRRLLPPETPRARYPGFKPETAVLKKGSKRREGAKSLRCDILLERDVAVTLRDGNTIYADIFRPTTNGTYPGIVHWSPYGKETGNQHLDDIPGRYNVPLSSLSELQKWEANDPAEWVCNGYAILQPDTRGAFSSTGNFPFWGRQLAEDGYDFIEWAANQTWSSGKLGMSGNSWLTISQ